MKDSAPEKRDFQSGFKQGCLRFLFVILILGLFRSPAGGQELDELSKKIHSFLQTHCHRCHGENGSAEGGLNHILDWQRLIDTGMINLNDLENSVILQRVVDGEMPADDETKPVAEEIETLREWLKRGAPNFSAPAAERMFVSPDLVDDRIYQDLNTLAARDRRFARFFTLTHLYNEGAPDDELQTYRNALTKLVNSLSWGRKVIKLVPTDTDEIIFRIDLRDLNWSVSLWDQIVKVDPYRLEPTGDRLPIKGFGYHLAKKQEANGFEIFRVLPDSPASKAGLQIGDVLVSLNGDSLADIDLEEYQRRIRSSERTFETFEYIRNGQKNSVEISAQPVVHPRRSNEIADLTRARVYSLRGDWFVANASRPPLYHLILDIPDNIAELETRLGVNVAQNYFNEMYLRSGFNGSGVSRNNRLIEQHDSHFGSYWKSFDFASNSNRQNLFANPFGPGNGDKFFEHDGGEMIFTLPNGFQGYMLTDAEGNRIDKGPTAIVSDPQRPDRAVENGISCMSCHAQGLIRKSDQILNHVNANQNSFVDNEINLIRTVHRANLLEQKFDRDIQQFAAANEEAGVPLSRYEPILLLAKKFEQEMTAKAVAAELQVEEKELPALLAKDNELSRMVGQVLVPGGTVQRETFESAFPALTSLTNLKFYDRTFLDPHGQFTSAKVRGLFDDGLLFSKDALQDAPDFTTLSQNGYDLVVFTLREPLPEDLLDSIQGDNQRRFDNMKAMVSRIRNRETELFFAIIDEPIRGQSYAFISASTVNSELRTKIFNKVSPLLNQRKFDQALNLLLNEVNKLPKLEPKPATPTAKAPNSK